jgi:hypothetical protein
MKILVFILLLVSTDLFAQQFALSDDAEISVITCGPSQRELYTAFGHSAFRVRDPARQFDVAYNYGMFDFDQPNFYLNFARGYLYYRLGTQNFRDFVYPYMYYNRSVREQILNLTKDQKQAIFDYLQVNALPENQQYRYDYFYDNCATKIRDVVAEALGPDAVNFDGSYVTTDYTIRELTDLYLQEQPWGDLGIDICLGLPMDKTATPYEYMFLPDYIESGFDHATIRAGGEMVSIVREKNVIYATRDQDQEAGALPHPLYIFSAFAALAVILSLLDLRRRKLSTWFDALLFGSAGAIGLLLFFLWFFTDHNAAARNMNILWAFPAHLVAAIAFLKNPRWLKNYFLFAFILCLVLLACWAILPQQLHYALVPLVVALGLRSYVQFRMRMMNTVPVATSRKKQTAV